MKTIATITRFFCLAFVLISALTVPNGAVGAEETQTSEIDLSGNEKLIQLNTEYQNLRLAHDQKMQRFLHDLKEANKRAAVIGNFLITQKKILGDRDLSPSDMLTAHRMIIAFFYDVERLIKFFYDVENERDELYKKLDELEVEVHSHVQEKIVKDILQ